MAGLSTRHLTTTILVLTIFIITSTITSGSAQENLSAGAYCIPLSTTMSGSTPDVALVGFTFGVSDGFAPICGLGSDDSQGYRGNLTADIFDNGPDNTSRALMQPCSLTIQMFCIEEVDSRKFSEDSWKQGSLSATQPITDLKRDLRPPRGTYGTVFNGNDMSGGAATLWNFPGATHGGGQSYLVSLAVMHPPTALPFEKSRNWKFAFQIVPITLGPSLSLDVPETTAKVDDYQIYDFPSDVEYKLVLRWDETKIPFTQTWLYGRVKDFTESYDSSKHSLVLTGFPMSVPVAELPPVPLAKIPFALLDENSRDQYQAMRIYHNILGSGYENVNKITDALDASERLGAKTVASRTYWIVRRQIMSSAQVNSSSCWDYGGGYSMNNGTVYNAGIPEWNSASSTLNYKVASTHFDQNHKPNLGYFKMAIDRSLVACLWGGSPESAKVDVQIVDLNGTQQSASLTTSSFDSKYFYFTASGFTYSSPTIKVHLSLLSSTTIRPKLAASASPAPGKARQPRNSKITITCLKGKITKKVTSLSPKCPSGYKKK